MSGGIIDADFYAKNLVHAFLACLDVARQEFSLLVNLFEDPFEYCFRKGVDSDFGLLPELEAAIFGFGNVDAYEDLIFFEKSGDRGIGSDEVARAHVENFNDGGGGSRDLALTEAGFVVGIGCSCEVDVFATVPALEFFQVGLCLGRAGFRDFFGTVAALGFFGVGTGLLEGSPQFLLVKSDKDLARLDRIAFADQNLVDAAADFGADADVARFNGTRALQGGVEAEPAGKEPRGGQHSRSR